MPGEHESEPSFVLLPGFDGSSQLFDRTLDARPDGLKIRTISLSRERVMLRDELVNHMRSQLPPGPVVLVAESFAGPIALRLARRINPVAVVLCATFVRSPLPRWLTPTTLLSFLCKSAPLTGIAGLLTGGDFALARAVQSALAKVDRPVLASRITLASQTDARRDLRKCPCPVLLLHARRDRLLGYGHVKDMLAERHDLETVEIDAPHLLLQVAPERAWPEIMSFLARRAGVHSVPEVSSSGEDHAVRETG